MSRLPSCSALIASDVDGTLIRHPDEPLSAALISAVRGLKKRGVLFCAASGRSYSSLQTVFEPLLDDVLLLTENGAQAFWQGEMLHTIYMERELCRSAAHDILSLPGCELRVSTADGCYLIPKGEEIVQRSRRKMGSSVHIVSSFDEIPPGIVKLSAFCPDGVGQAASILLPRWGREAGAAVTGSQWIDLTAAGKDFGLQLLCRRLGLSSQDVTAFGDNWNDCSMLAWAGKAYLMEGADPLLRRQFPSVCTDVAETLRRIETTRPGEWNGQK